MKTLSQRPKFLTAEWRKLIVANYEIDPILLTEYLPRGVELDSYRDKHWVSLVGFLFLNTKVLGFGIPFHKNFEEFNLRFYVRHKTEEGWRRGVVFIKEIVPKLAISLTANIVYREPYICRPMDHTISLDERSEMWKIRYDFKNADTWNHIQVLAKDNPRELVEGSMEEFILEHYWGYNRYDSHTTMEYQVEHPVWKTYEVTNHSILIDAKSLYGEGIASFLDREPASVCLAEGSEIIVRKGRKLDFSKM